MKHRRRLLSGLLLIGLIPLAGWLWFARLHTPAWTIVEPGARLTSDHLDVCSNTLVVVPPGPGVVFATVRKLGGDEEFTYILLLKYGRRITSHSTTIDRGDRSRHPQTLLEHFGKWAETGAAFQLNGKRVEALYRVELDETQTAVTHESLTIVGKQVDMAAGRVFLIDLTIDPPAFRQVRVELPAVPSELKSGADAERAADSIRERLESQTQEIKEFLR